MAIPQQLTIELIFDTAATFMGIASGGLKEIAPPEMPKTWTLLGTITAAGAFLSAKLLIGSYGIEISQRVWFGFSIAFMWLAVICCIVYVLTRSERTIVYEGETKLAGSKDEYLDDVKNDQQNNEKNRDELLRDATGDVGDVWTPHALSKSRRILGIEYTILIALLAFGAYLGVEAYNTQKPVLTFAERTSKLKDVHFELNGGDLSTDAANILDENAQILKDVFKNFSNATVILEGYCDDRGSEGGAHRCADCQGEVDGVQPW
jgi:outer membrane protein OmpA-like peptidoglycan-associated protein